jgi:hypothetical protein
MKHLKSFNQINEILGFGPNKEHEKVGNYIISVLYNLIQKKYKNPLSYYLQYIDDNRIYIHNIGKDESMSNPDRGFNLIIKDGNFYYSDYKEYLSNIHISRKHHNEYDYSYPKAMGKPGHLLKLSNETKNKILQNLKILNNSPEKEKINQEYNK